MKLTILLAFLAATATNVLAIDPNALASLNDNGACTSLEQPCLGDTTGLVNATTKPVCLAAFLCASPIRTFNQTIDDMAFFKFPPRASEQPRMPNDIFKQHSSDGEVWTEQNFVDFYYGQLDARTHVFPASVAPVQAAWKTVAAWTGFCSTRNIPYQNLADWFRWSSTVGGATSQC